MKNEHRKEMTEWEIVPGTNRLHARQKQSVNPMRVCACGCGSVLGSNPRQKYASDVCRFRNRTKTRPFVALDGEGARNEYVLLAAADSQGKYKSIGTKQGLDTESCLEFLLQLPRGSDTGRKPIYVWFAFDYDINMILKDVPLRGENSIEQLRQENTIHWRGYRITYLHRKIFRIARGKRRHTSYDIWGFFQASFERSLEKWGIESSKIIEQGKASRSGFDNWTLTRIRDYNKEELIKLATLAEKLREAVAPLELPIQSWHGPAALAQAWLQKHKTKNFLAPTPEPMEDPVRRAYFGGRIDVAGYGYIDPVYHYDIVSAYPSAIRNLPDLTKLRWIRRTKRVSGSGIYLVHIRWRGSNQIWNPFPWRDRSGTILWPSEGESWVWHPEYEAALHKFPDADFEVIEWFQAEGEYSYPFRDLIESTFRHRAKLKAEKNPAHVPAKLILNSLYGKFAQTVGKASYHSLIWAGLITSQTRAQLLSAITDDVVCVMTDSIWSKEPLELPTGNNLGDWESQDENKLWLAEAGLYEAESPDGSRYVWQRGFDKRNPVDIRKIVSLWLKDDPFYEAVYTVHRFIGMGLALATHYPWRHWIDIERRIQPVSLAGTTKRYPAFPLAYGEKYPSEPHFQTLDARGRTEDTCSYPYSRITLDENLIRERLEDECDEDA